MGKPKPNAATNSRLPSDPHREADDRPESSEQPEEKWRVVPFKKKKKAEPQSGRGQSNRTPAPRKPPRAEGSKRSPKSPRAAGSSQPRKPTQSPRSTGSKVSTPPSRSQRRKQSKQSKQSAPKQKPSLRGSSPQCSTPAAPAQMARRDRPRRGPPPRFTSESDNDAQQAWRTQQNPRETISLPAELAVQSDAQQQIARQHNTFIFKRDDTEEASTGPMTFGIWGEDADVRTTRAALLAWVQESKQTSTHSYGGGKFAKVQSTTPELQKHLEKQWKRSVKRERYRQFPAPGRTFEAIGSFHWPVQEYRPADVLGASYEALDPIRMDCECHVVFAKDKSLFQVMGTEENVLKAVLRLRKTCFQVAARQIVPIRKYLLYWPNGAIAPRRILLVKVEDQVRDDVPGLGYVLRADGRAESQTGLDEQSSVSEERIRTSLLNTLKKLHYYRGNIQMRICLGTFLATSFKRLKGTPITSYGLKEYEGMIQQTQFEGGVSHEIGHAGLEHRALEALQHAEDLLQPEDALSATLLEVRPVYSAAFIFEDDAGNFCLEITWHELEEVGATTKNFERVARKWTRFERDEGAPTAIFDTSLTDLSTGLSWHFGIAAAQLVEEARLPKALISFERSVTINAKVALIQDTDRLFVDYRIYGGSLKHVQQRISYRYNIRSPTGPPTDYTLELTRFQERTYPAGSATTERPKDQIPRWSLSVFRTEWATMFAQNGNLKVGEMAGWDHGADTWFPPDLPQEDGDEDKEDGFQQLMESLKKIVKVVREAPEEDLLLG